MTPDEQNAAYERTARAVLGDAEYERIQREVTEGMARIDAHYAKLTRQRHRELIAVGIVWAINMVAIVINALAWHSEDVRDATLFVNCIIIAKAVYDFWRAATGRYPPQVPKP